MSFRALILPVLALFGACGDPTDRPEDCSPNEYFDEARKLCFTCPAVAQPHCDDGCGFVVTADERGCPAAQCLLGDDCSGCGPTEYVDESLQCVPCAGPSSCANGEPVRVLTEGDCTLQCP